MMGPKSHNFVRVDYPNSMDTLLSLIEVLKDPKLFDKQLQALKQYIDKANQSIEVLGKAEQIDHLLADAKVKQNNIDKLHSEAQAEADQILKTASTKADALLSTAKSQAQALQSEAREIYDRIKTDQQDVEHNKQRYEQLLKQVNEKDAALDKRTKEIAEIEKEITRKKALLSQL